MDEKPELIAFSENKIGGVQTYFYNLLSNDPTNTFDKFWIFTENVSSSDAKLIRPYNFPRQTLFQYGTKPLVKTAAALSHLISNRPGVVLANHPLELIALHRHRKRNKTIFFFCHDELYVPTALQYEFLIDVFITHNVDFFDALRKAVPARAEDVFFLPYGIEPSSHVRQPNVKKPLKILFIARLTEKKGVFDLQRIDDILLSDRRHVEWTIIGDGPEKGRLQASLANRDNFTFFSPPSTQEILSIAASHDVFVLPSYLDGMPVALLEAMSAGLVPVIYRFNEGVQSVVTPDIGFAVDVGNVAELARTISYLDSNRDEMEARSTRARRKILEEYMVKERTIAYYNLFERFRNLKKPMRNKIIKFDGVLDYPFIPQVFRDALHLITKVLRK